MIDYIDVGDCVLELALGDITNEKTDAIVNAANSQLAGGLGVDGAIHRAGGPTILQECKKIGGCPPGEAIITTAGKMNTKYVIHTVGPIYRGGHNGEAKTLALAYKNSLALALEKNVASISFPSISTGAYGYPLREAAFIALETVIEFLEKNKAPPLVRFVLYSQDTYNAYLESLKLSRESP